MKGFVLYGMVGAKDPLPLTLTMEKVNVEMRYRIDQQHRIDQFDVERCASLVWVK